MNHRAESFAARLHAVCTDELRLPVGRGRDSALARRFSVTPNAAGKWLRGDSYPEMDRVIQICEAAGISLNWLMMGVGPRKMTGQNPLAEAVSRAIEAMPAGAGIEVGNFVRYQLQQSAVGGVSEAAAQYIADVTDGIQRVQKGQ